VNMEESLCGVNTNGWTLQLVLLMTVNGWALCDSRVLESP
jgi:hypothetical protein